MRLNSEKQNAPIAASLIVHHRGANGRKRFRPRSRGFRSGALFGAWLADASWTSFLLRFASAAGNSKSETMALRDLAATPRGIFATRLTAQNATPATRMGM